MLAKSIESASECTAPATLLLGFLRTHWLHALWKIVWTVIAAGVGWLLFRWIFGLA